MSKSLIKGALDIDPWLEPYSNQLISRQLQYRQWLETLEKTEGSLAKFASSYERYGLHANTDTKEVTITEYIPDVQLVSLVGDFNGWDVERHQLQKVNDFGLWSLTIPPVKEDFAVPHDSKYKISMVTRTGERIYRLDPWVRRATFNRETTTYEGRFWNPSLTYTFKQKRPELNDVRG